MPTVRLRDASEYPEPARERGVMELVGVTRMFSSYTKIADTLQLESDMGGIAPVDTTGVPDVLDAP